MELAGFLNGLINLKRGKREGPQPDPEETLTNNVVLRKFKIAMNWRDEDILETLMLGDMRFGKHELSALFRKPTHSHYRLCKDQLLRKLDIFVYTYKSLVMQRTLKKIYPADKVNMGGHLLDQPLPNATLDNLDPFLLIHHWHQHLPGGQRQQEVGVGPHPHRGFSPVTFVFKGAVKHQDSLGEKATVGAGGTQWMFAGRGVTHSERFPKKLAEEGGELEFIQFWVNAPAEYKMAAPYYQPISLEDTPLIEQEKSKLWVVTGKLNGVRGAAPTYSPQLLLRGELQKDGKVNIPVPQSFNALVYVIEGSLKTTGGQLLPLIRGISYLVESQ